MVRISAFLIAVCMVLIAGALGVAVYARFGFTGAESALAGLGALTALAVITWLPPASMIALKSATSSPNSPVAPPIWLASLLNSTAA